MADTKTQQDVLPQDEEEEARCRQCGGELENMSRTQVCYACLEDHWRATH